MRYEYKWGPSLDYYLAALKGYINIYQNINADSSIPPSVALNIIDDISNMENPGKYNKKALEIAKSHIVGNEEIIDGSSVSGVLEGKEVLLVAQTKISVKYQDAVIDYVNNRSPKIKSINYPSLTKTIVFDHVFISHNQKDRFEKK